MKRTGPHLVGAIITGLLLLSGCGGAQAGGEFAQVAEGIARTAGEGVLRGSGDEALRGAEGTTLRTVIAGRIRAASGIRSEIELAQAGEPVSVAAIRSATGRAAILRAEFGAKLASADGVEGSGKAIDLGGAVVKAHCSGLKKELGTRTPATKGDYLIYLTWAVLETQLPTPPAKQLEETAENLVKIGRELRSRTIDDEAARRAYMKETCKIT